MKLNMPTITLILCTCNRASCVRRLLNSLGDHEIVFDQIIIVDASNTSETKQAVDSFSDLNIEYYKTARGLVAQRNFGLGKATGDIIGFFDDDVVVSDKGFREAILAAFDKTDAGSVVPYVYENNSRDIPGFKGFVFKISNRLWGRVFITMLVGKNYMPDRVFDGYINNVLLSGCAFFCKKEVYSHYQFSEWMRGYSFYEDFDFCLRISERYNVVGIGQARVHHYSEPSARDTRVDLAKMRIYNLLRILSESKLHNRFLKIILVVHRLHLATIYEILINLAKFRFTCACNSFVGFNLGLIKSYQYLFCYDSFK